jgi:GNAT superfamily N-acetyltransferase
VLGARHAAGARRALNLRIGECRASLESLYASWSTGALRDGAEILMRPVRPSDYELLREGFADLSQQSRYQRFLAPMERLPDSMVRYLTEVDHHDHEAIVALDPVSGRGIGVARFVRLRDRPGVAEAAVTVIDDWQGRGVGTLLLEALALRAREEGIETFTAIMLAANHEILEVLEHLARVRVIDRQMETVQVEVDIPPTGFTPQFRELLRASYGGVRAIADASVHNADRRARPQ